MRIDSSKVIGEGTYGCIHKPSLTCDVENMDGKKIDYTNMVSKIMEKSEVDKELREYSKISSIDNLGEFYLGKVKPFKCRPDKSVENANAIKKCTSGNEFISSMNENDDIRLMIMTYGGITLETLAERLKNVEGTPALKRFMERFWLETHRLLRGLKLFEKNGFIHHDLKPQNIVYDINTNRLNYIDFGIVQMKDDVIRKSLNNRYKLAIHHWSLPTEMPLYNKSFFDTIVENKKSDIMHKYLDDSNDTLYEISKYIYNKNSHLSESYLSDMNIDFKNQLLNYIPNTSYSEFIDTSVSTIDIYGVGFTLLYVLLNTEHLISIRFAKSLYNIFYDMVTPDLAIRYRIDELIRDYEVMLENCGIPERMHKKLTKNHTYVDISNDTTSKIMAQPLGLPNVKTCESNRELNPHTNKCVVLCGVKSKRNENFKCVSKKRTRSVKGGVSQTRRRLKMIV